MATIDRMPAPGAAALSEGGPRPEPGAQEDETGGGGEPPDGRARGDVDLVASAIEPLGGYAFPMRLRRSREAEEI